MAEVMTQLQGKLKEAYGSFNELNKEMQKSVSARSKLEIQLQENDMVKQEFQRLKDDSAVYKLLGPVMIKHDLAEAKVNIEKRLEFIQIEVKRADKQIADIESKQAKRKSEIEKMQKDYQHMLHALEEAAKQHGGQ